MEECSLSDIHGCGCPSMFVHTPLGGGRSSLGSHLHAETVTVNYQLNISHCTQVHLLSLETSQSVNFNYLS